MADPRSILFGLLPDTNDPLDGRTVADTIAERDAINPQVIYEGLVVYVKETKLNYTLTNTDPLTWELYQGPQGIQGETGDTGEKGNQGIGGPTGPRGFDGERGEQGVQGDKGDQGELGPAGADGSIGARGPKGNTGTEGIQGDPGADGIDGVDGDIGETGPKGDTGEMGASGIGLMPYGTSFPIPDPAVDIEFRTFNLTATFEGNEPGIYLVKNGSYQLIANTGSGGGSGGDLFVDITKGGTFLMADGTKLPSGTDATDNRGNSDARYNTVIYGGTTYYWIQEVGLPKASIIRTGNITDGAIAASKTY